jgi:hypothetical protein
MFDLHVFTIKNERAEKLLYARIRDSDQKAFEACLRYNFSVLFLFAKHSLKL